jgi:hypothetical protein
MTWSNPLVCFTSKLSVEFDMVLLDKSGPPGSEPRDGGLFRATRLAIMATQHISVGKTEVEVTRGG